MYNSSPFEGVKLVNDYDNEYIISVLSLEKGTNSFSILSRVAQVKAQRQVSTFFNGSTITAEFIIKTTEEKADSIEVKTTVETIGSLFERQYRNYVFIVVVVNQFYAFKWGAVIHSL